MKLDEGDENYEKGLEVEGGRTGRFLEKPDIIDKFCRRYINEYNPELEELIAIHFAKMYEPIRRKVKEEDNEEPDVPDKKEEDKTEDENKKNTSVPPWTSIEDRVTNYYITGNSSYNLKKTSKIHKNKKCNRR